jgi:hypothetical protein
MKKLLLILAVAGTVAACTNEKKSGEGENKGDSTKTEAPVTPAPAAPDSTKTAMPAKDSTKK